MWRRNAKQCGHLAQALLNDGDTSLAKEFADRLA